MKALVTEGIDKMVVKEVKKPAPGAHEVLVEVKAAGLCGSDFHIYHGSYPAKYPIIQGHEFSGVIAEVGSQIRDWKVGQRVTVDPNIFCHHCYYCLKDQENMCENSDAIGVTLNGGFAEYAVVPESQLYELPEELSFEDGAMIEPLACVLYGVKRLNLPYGSSVIIFGAGPMGLLLMKAIQTGGASTMVMVDLDDARLETAKTMGATDISHSAEEAKKKYPRGFDAVIDATGNPKVIQAMFTVAAKRAKILQFGCANSDATFELNPFEVYNNDWEYLGTRIAVYTYTQAIDMIKTGRISVRDVVSEVVSPETLMSYLENGKPAGALKIVLQP